MKLHPPSVTVSTYTSVSNAVAFQPSAVLNTRMSLGTQPAQPAQSFPSPPCPLRSAPSGFLNTILLGSRPPLIWISSAPAPKILVVRNVVSMLPHRVISRARLYEVRDYLFAWSLVLCPDAAKQNPMVYGAELGVVLLAKDPRTASLQKGFVCLGPNHLGLEGESYLRLVLEFTSVPPDAQAAYADPPSDFMDIFVVPVSAPPS